LWILLEILAFFKILFVVLKTKKNITLVLRNRLIV
jgi:hypothetical protein